MTPRVKAIRKDETKVLASRILRIVNNHEDFMFYRAIGDFTGEKAKSLSDFKKKLQFIDIQSVDFHFGRGDFRRWINFILEDVELATRINRIPQYTRGEKLRGYLLRIVNERLIELKSK
jgi:hypothetical protein